MPKTPVFYVVNRLKPNGGGFASGTVQHKVFELGEGMDLPPGATKAPAGAGLVLEWTDGETPEIAAPAVSDENSAKGV